MTLPIKKTSLKKLIDGGHPMLITKIKNHEKLTIGKILRIPLQIITLRELKYPYVRLAKENIQGEHRPCANIKQIPPIHPV